jgi:hypothetical protein
MTVDYNEPEANKPRAKSAAKAKKLSEMNNNGEKER